MMVLQQRQRFSLWRLISGVLATRRGNCHRGHLWLWRGGWLALHSGYGCQLRDIRQCHIRLVRTWVQKVPRNKGKHEQERGHIRGLCQCTARNMIPLSVSVNSANVKMMTSEEIPSMTFTLGPDRIYPQLGSQPRVLTACDRTGDRNLGALSMVISRKMDPVTSARA